MDYTLDDIHIMFKNNSVENLIRAFVSTKDKYVKMCAINSAAMYMGEKSIPFYNHIIENGKVSECVAVSHAIHLLKNKALPLYNKLVKKGKKVQLAIARNAYRIKGNLSLYDKFSRSQHVKILRETAKYVYRCGLESLPIYDRLSENKHVSVRAMVAFYVDMLGIESLPVYEKLCSDSSILVRCKVFERAYNLGDKTLPIYEDAKGGCESSKLYGYLHLNFKDDIARKYYSMLDRDELNDLHRRVCHLPVKGFIRYVNLFGHDFQTFLAEQILD